MIAAVLGIITSRFAGPIALAGCAVLAFMLVGAKMETGRARGDLKAQVAESKRLAGDLATCRGNVTTLEGSLARQNDAVAAAKADGERMAATAVRAATEARSARVLAETRARDIMSARSNARTCEERESVVFDLAREAIR
jgi:hypothetical protein